MAGTPPSGQSCGNCAYMIQQGSSPNYWYECHHDPDTQTPQTNEWRHVLQSDWCGDWSDTVPPGTMPVVSGTANAPTGTNSAAGVMMGLGLIQGFSITPVKTGRIAAMIGGCVTASGANAAFTISGMHGSGTAPANGAAGVGTPWSVAQAYAISSAKDVSGFTVIGGNTGLPLNVAHWFDLALAITAGGTVSVTDVQSLLWEL